MQQCERQGPLKRTKSGVALTLGGRIHDTPETIRLMAHRKYNPNPQTSPTSPEADSLATMSTTPQPHKKFKSIPSATVTMDATAPPTTATTTTAITASSGIVSSSSSPVNILNSSGLSNFSALIATAKPGSSSPPSSAPNVS
eukprot:c20962_g1_i1.p1 GENE.c20962_g1_i1~~c20962_g1_i1.p1  ORF type:complete len:142 (-),score=39.61 c20962_g1_i1:279-704(-)